MIFSEATKDNLLVVQEHKQDDSSAAMITNFIKSYQIMIFSTVELPPHWK